MKSLILVLSMFAGTAGAAPRLTCNLGNSPAGSIVIAPAGNGIVSARGSFIDEAGRSIPVSCTGSLIGSGAVPGFGDNVETFWFTQTPACRFDFMQLDDSAYRLASGPMRLTCNQESCVVRKFICAK
ncbi:MAG: hypothetical protein ACXVB9_20055 [Bdellovibrionota bacterium]